ncbi:MAG: hypothetical protein AAB567_00890 [Patescibacteria group bacterium]
MIPKNARFGKKRSSIFEHVAISVVFFLVFGGILGFFIFQNIKIGMRRTALSAELSQLQGKAQELSTRKEELQVKILQTQTEEYQEKILRERGLYRKPEEEVVTIVPPEKEVKEEAPSSEKKRTWWNPLNW